MTLSSAFDINLIFLIILLWKTTERQKTERQMTMFGAILSITTFYLDQMKAEKGHPSAPEVAPVIYAQPRAF
jgi:hypothetical protein